MPLPGGTSDKLGNRYEGRWTALAIFEVLRERAEAIRLEPPGTEGDGIEFYVRYSNHKHFHQVKRQRTGGDWTIAALRGAGVLATFRDRLADPTAHCTFASTHSASSLQDLTDKARSALSWSEFERDFVISRADRRDLAAIRHALGATSGDALLDALRRIHVETNSEDGVRRNAMLHAEIVLQGDLVHALPTLLDIVSENVNRYLTADELWHQLAKYNLKPSLWRSPQPVVAQVQEVNTRYVESRRATLIQKHLIPRVEAKQLAEAIAAHKLVLLDGVAGAGKSDVVLRFVEDLATRGVPHLVFRLDHTAPTTRPEELGRNLGLPGSPSAALAAVAQGREAVLVIDQLDAVSTTSGRNPEFFECVSDIVRTAQSSSSVRVVLVCRTFDVQNDRRMLPLVERGKDHTTVTVGLLDPSVVNDVVAKLGYGEGSLLETQLELLRVPLHLSLLVGAVGTDKKRPRFATSLDLLSAFWETKRDDLDRRLGAGPWNLIVEALVEYMSKEQVLRARAGVVDTWKRYVDGMVSANVLTREAHQLGFFHETFFDYAFAHTFLNRGRSIRDLLAEDQFLFRRAQVRQILAHEQLSPGNEYKRDLSYLVQDSSVRFHIKDLVLAWLSQLSPTAFEWSLVQPLLLDESSPLFGRAWRLLISEDWFKHADSVGFVSRYLRTEDHLTESMVSIVSVVSKMLPERAAELFGPFADDPKWSKRFDRLISQADLAASRSLFELCLKWIDRLDRTLDDQVVSIVAHAMGELAKKRPDWMWEALARFSRRRIAQAWDAGYENPFDDVSHAFPHSLHLELLIGEAANAEPLAFLVHVWPVMFDVVEHTIMHGGADGLRLDRVWSTRHIGVDSLHDAFLTAGEAAFRHAAKFQPEVFDRLLSEHSSTSYDTVTYLLYQGFAADPSRYADRAIEFVLADVRRLSVRYSNGPNWGTRQLFDAITPFASDPTLARLEKALLAYDADIRWRDDAQFELLGGIAKERRSPAVVKRIGELQRKLNVDDAAPPKGIYGGTVRSPIPAAAASNMTDEQWRGAIARYSYGHRDRLSTGEDFLRGGAEELAHVLVEETKRDAERFARLGLTLKDDTHDAYFYALLRGLAEAEEQPSLETVQLLIERCHALPTRPSGRWIAGPLAKRASEDIPDSLLDILSWYALNDPEPDADRDQTDNQLDLMNKGLNSVRGSIAVGVAELIQAKPSRYRRMEAAARALCSDRVAAVRAMAAQIVCSLVDSTRDEDQALFLQLVDGADERILTTRCVQLYLVWQATDDFLVLRSVIERMIASKVASVRESGAIHMCRVALSRSDARDVADACAASPDESLRLGAARVAAANFKSKDDSARCSAALKKFFNDEAPKIRQAAGNALWRLEGAELADHVDLAHAFLDSAAFEANSDDLIHALKETTAAVPELIVATCLRALDALESGQRGPLAFRASEALGLLVRAYSGTHDVAEKNRVLHILDRALQLDVYGMQKLLSDHDRWWGKS